MATLDEGVEFELAHITVFKKPVKVKINQEGITFNINGSPDKCNKLLKWELLIRHEPRERDWKLGVERMLRIGALTLSDPKPPVAHDFIKSAMSMLGAAIIHPTGHK